MEPRYDFTSRFLNINSLIVQDFLGQGVHSIERKFNVIIVLVFLIQDLLKVDSDFFRSVTCFRVIAETTVHIVYLLDLLLIIFR